MNQKEINRQRRHTKIRKKVYGTSERPRLVVFRSLYYTSAQLIDDTQGKTLVAFSDMKGIKGTKSARAAEVGTELAKKASLLNITTCVFDRNGYKYHGRIKALAEAARKAGLTF